MGLLDGFATARIKTSGAEIALSMGGSGPPLLLLHGYPQTRLIWHKVAHELSQHFFIVMPDLRGYGQSSKPPAGENFINYSKREMACDMVEVMEELGQSTFQMVGHDRGGRVGHRLAADWPEKIERLCVLDIAPTREMYVRTGLEFARAYWHWFFLIQPAPLPEDMIAADPKGFLMREMSTDGSASLRSYDYFHEDALAEYVACLGEPETNHAMCNDYRAAVGIDIAHDDADGGKKLTCPLHVIWGSKGVIEKCFDPIALWQLRAETVTGEVFDCGHYIPEECPAETIESIRKFFSR
ncbi:MAG: alpha/beta fold hydrolase [Hyphomicrobiales bacterium]